MLLNYERTVKDFGKCDGNAKYVYIKAVPFKNSWDWE